MQQDPNAAMAAAQALAPLNVYWRKEPVIPDAYAEPLPALPGKEDSRLLPVATAENLHSRHESN